MTKLKFLSLTLVIALPLLAIFVELNMPPHQGHYQKHDVDRYGELDKLNEDIFSKDKSRRPASKEMEEEKEMKEPKYRFWDYGRRLR